MKSTLLFIPIVAAIIVGMDGLNEWKLQASYVPCRKKGYSPDNSACEGFFGRLKNEMFYGHSWKDISVESFIEAVNMYIRWYNEARIKESLGWMSPMQYRRSLGLIG